MERGLWHANLKGESKVKEIAGKSTKHALAGEDNYQSCCARRLIANQPDFLAQLCWLEEVITAAGHKAIFLPKFHPELNAIERYWGCLKKCTRWCCDDSLYSLRKNVNFFLNTDKQCDLTRIRKYYRICWRYMDAYSKGMSAELAKFAVTKYKSHRMISGTLDKQIEEAIARQFAKELQRDEEREDGGGEEEEEQQDEGPGLDEEDAEVVREIYRGGSNEDGEDEELDEETLMRGFEDESL